MFRMYFSSRGLLYTWIVLHVILLIMSGYFQTLGEAYFTNHWSHFLEIHSKFYPFDTTNLANYDPSELSIYLIIPIIVYRFFSKFLPSRRRRYYALTDIKKR